jgi:Ca2+-transporting ATPase
VFNWILIFGVFEWIRRTTGDIPLARTMAIQALVAGRIIYLLSISQFWASVAARMRGLKVPLGDVSAIGYGIAVAIAFRLSSARWA